MGHARRNLRMQATAEEEEVEVAGPQGQPGQAQALPPIGWQPRPQQLPQQLPGPPMHPIGAGPQQLLGPFPLPFQGSHMQPVLAWRVSRCVCIAGPRPNATNQQAQLPPLHC